MNRREILGELGAGVLSHGTRVGDQDRPPEVATTLARFAETDWGRYAVMEKPAGQEPPWRRGQHLAGDAVAEFSLTKLGLPRLRPSLLGLASRALPDARSSLARAVQAGW